MKYYQLIRLFFLWSGPYVYALISIAPQTDLSLSLQEINADQSTSPVIQDYEILLDPAITNYALGN